MRGVSPSVSSGKSNNNIPTSQLKQVNSGSNLVGSLQRSNSGLLQRGSSGNSLTGNAMSFVMQQRQVQERQIKASASKQDILENREYVRTISTVDDLEEEFSGYGSDPDEVLELTEQDMDDMFDDLITSSSLPQIDLQLAPMLIKGYNIATI